MTTLRTVPPLPRQVPILFLGTLLLVNVCQAQPEGMPPAPIVVAKVQSITQAESKSFVGSLVPIRSSTVGSAVDGRVIKMFVDEGDAVKMESSGTASSNEILGQPMVQLRTVALDIEIEAAKLELAIRQMAYQELQTSLPSEIQTAAAVIEEIKARLKYSRENYDRLKDLATKGGGVSQREMDEAFSIFRSQSQLILAAESRLNKLTSTKDDQLGQARLNVDAQRAAIRRLEEQKSEFTIRAPFAGFITLKNTELGEWVKRGDQVMEIIQLDPIELIVPVPQAYIQQLQTSIDDNDAAKTKLTAIVSVESVTGLFEGEIIQINPQADLRSRSFPVRIRIKNPKTGNGHLLKAGMLAQASMFIGAEKRLLMVPKDGLVLGGSQKSLFVVRTDPQSKKSVVVPVSIQVGASIGNWIHVEGGIKEGDQVDVEGNERLRPNQEVSIMKEIQSKKGE